MTRNRLLFAAAAVLVLAGFASAQSLDIPSHAWGLSFGNSKTFDGLRFNYRDRGVVRVRGLNVTLWAPHEKDDNDSLIQGVSLGLIPGGGTLHGLQIGLLGVAGVKNVRGISFGFLGVGTGGSLIGVNVGGLGAGAGGNITGINIGGLGLGASGDVKGVNIGGLGLGSGKNLIGVNIAGVGMGASEKVAGLNIAGIAVGAGDVLGGITIAGIAAGSSEIRGLAFAGGVVGAKTICGLVSAGGCTLISDGGELRGGAVAPVNWIKGTQQGVVIGIVNYAWSLKGLQIGLVNIVRDNPSGRKVLPLVNWNF